MKTDTDNDRLTKIPYLPSPTHPSAIPTSGDPSIERYEEEGGPDKRSHSKSGEEEESQRPKSVGRKEKENEWKMSFLHLVDLMLHLYNKFL